MSACALFACRHGNPDFLKEKDILSTEVNFAVFSFFVARALKLHSVAYSSISVPKSDIRLLHFLMASISCKAIEILGILVNWQHFALVRPSTHAQKRLLVSFWSKFRYHHLITCRRPRFPKREKYFID